MAKVDRPDHGEIVETVLDTWKHDNEDVLRCERCHVMVPIDEPEKFGEYDCDQYKAVREGVDL